MSKQLAEEESDPRVEAFQALLRLTWAAGEKEVTAYFNPTKHPVVVTVEGKLFSLQPGRTRVVSGSLVVDCVPRKRKGKRWMD